MHNVFMSVPVSLTIVKACVCVSAATLNGQHIVVKHSWPVFTFAVIYSFTLCVARHRGLGRKIVCVCAWAVW